MDEDIHVPRRGGHVIRARTESFRPSRDNAKDALMLPPRERRARARRCLIYRHMHDHFGKIDYRPAAVAGYPYRPTEDEVDAWLASLQERHDYYAKGNRQHRDPPRRDEDDTDEDE